MGFKKADIRSLSVNPYTIFNDGWALISARREKDWNSMTISWGSLGCLWNKPVLTAYVRQNRYTYEFTEASEYFAVSVFEPGQYRPELGVLGSKSGRDMDKMNYPGLSTVELEGQIAYNEAKMVFICRRLYGQVMEEGCFYDKELMDKVYGPRETRSFHKVYPGEIVAVYVRD